MPEHPFKIPSDSEPQALLAWLENKHKDAQSVVPNFQPRINLAFYRGQHWLVLDPATNRLRKPADRPDDPNAPVRLQENIVGQLVDHIVARLTKSMPVPECRPVSDSAKDAGTSRAGTRILAHEMDRLKFKQILQDLYTWVVPVGWAFLQVTWNPRAGKFIGKHETEESEQNIFEGQVDVEVVPHYEIVFDPDARDISQARWAIRTIALTPEEIYERWGKVIELNDKAPGMVTLADELRELSERQRGGGAARKKVAVRQIWVRPGAMRDRPEGLIATWVGRSTFLDEPKEWPYKEQRKLPFIQFNYYPPQGTPFGRTPVTDLVPSQIDYNDARSRQAAIRRTLVPKLLAAAGTIDPNKVTSRLETIIYNDTLGQKPDLLMPDGRWTQQFEQAMARAHEAMGSRMGITKAATGELAGTSPAATAITLQEAATEPLQLPSQQLASGIEQFGWQTLMLIRQYWKESRKLRAMSDSGELDIWRFKRSDLNGKFDVHVTQESALPRSKAGRAELAIQLWRNEIIQDPQVLIKMLDLPHTDVLPHEFNRDARKQEREIAHMLKNKEQVPINDWDNHEVESATITRFMKESEFEELDEEQKALLEEHLHAHLAVLAQKHEAEIQEQQAMAGGGGGQGIADGIGGAQAAGEMNQSPEPIPGITELAKMGGLAGEPGQVPGLDPDITADHLGR